MYNLTVEQVIERTNTNVKTGLTQVQIEERTKRDGKNELAQKARTPALLRFAKQLTHVMNIILFVAFFLTVVIIFTDGQVKDYISSALIFVVIMINASIGFIQENKAEKAIDALKNQTKPYAKVLRDGVVVKIKNEDLCVGDIVLVEAGDIIPADLRLIEAVSLQVEQAALTGESIPSEKFTHAITETNIALGDQNNMAFSGGVATYGRGKGIVTAIGMQSEIGRIATQLNQQKDMQTPLTKRLNKTFGMIAIIVGLVSVFIFASRIMTGDQIISSLVITIAIAVCSIPEALPTCISITLSLATQRMSKKKAIIRSLPAVETLGSTQIICSDKTGTITLNKMTVQKTWSLKGDEELIKCMVLCNDTQTNYESGKLETIGDPTETALVHYADTLGIKKETLEKEFPRISELPFDSNRKLMSTLHGTTMYTKGAPNNLLDRCTKILDNGTIRNITKTDKENINKEVSNLARGALRVLAYAMKTVKGGKLSIGCEQDLVFIGLTGMIDPPREEVMESIKTCKEAGIKVVMITGDNRDTAFAIAKQVGIADDESQVMTGAQLNETSDEELIENIEKYTVYARVDPEHKVRIVHAFQAIDKIVAMTGDGVNDAPSIKAANIGVGMGITGTDVTKAAADMIITDDNFATIVDAVQEGRRVHTNVKKTIVYLLGVCMAELILLTFILVILRMPYFSAVLILWINVVTDTLPALVLGSLPAEKDVMKNGPNKTRGSMFKGKYGQMLFVTIIFFMILAGAAYFATIYVFGYSAYVATTVSYLVFVVLIALHAYNLVNAKTTIFHPSTFRSKWMNLAVIASILLGLIPILVPGAIQEAFGLVMLTGGQWLIGIAFGAVIIVFYEFYKMYLRRRDRKEKLQENIPL